ncbi:hypothetical protein JFX23_05875 [Schaalia cardiffensis]|uniref:DUF6318 family protein n=1 Tax=Schaalia cardiffensis TaxID=181487 RepID=UPI0018E7C612|nr:DUF6318 family protein [Schaalia cardiffensis]MBJ2329295.1 hypothetical protein [Schaalia cardiffensis]
MTRSSHAARVLALVLALSGLAMLSGCSVVSPSGAQSGSAAQSAEVVMSGDYILNEDGTLRKPHVTPSVPTMSEIAFQYNETGAEQAARHFIDLINYSWASGDTTALDEFSEERCTYCQTISGRVHDVYDNGGWAYGLKYTVSQVEGNYPVNTDSPETAQFTDCYVMSFLMHRSKADRYEPPTLEHVPAGTGRLILIVHWDGSEWKMSGVGGEDIETAQSE